MISPALFISLELFKKMFVNTFFWFVFTILIKGISFGFTFDSKLANHIRFVKDFVC